MEKSMWDNLAKIRKVGLENCTTKVGLFYTKVYGKTIHQKTNNDNIYQKNSSTSN